MLAARVVLVGWLVAVGEGLAVRLELLVAHVVSILGPVANRSPIVIASHVNAVTPCAAAKAALHRNNEETAISHVSFHIDIYIT